MNSPILETKMIVSDISVQADRCHVRLMPSRESIVDSSLDLVFDDLAAASSFFKGKVVAVIVGTADPE